MSGLGAHLFQSVAADTLPNQTIPPNRPAGRTRHSDTGRGFVRIRPLYALVAETMDLSLPRTERDNYDLDRPRAYDPGTLCLILKCWSAKPLTGTRRRQRRKIHATQQFWEMRVLAQSRECRVNRDPRNPGMVGLVTQPSEGFVHITESYADLESPSDIKWCRFLLI